MRRFRLVSLAILCVAAAAAVVVRAVRDGWEHLTVKAASPTEPPRTMDAEHAAAPQVMGKALSQCLQRRESPVVTPRWRMCPSV